MNALRASLFLAGAVTFTAIAGGCPGPVDLTGESGTGTGAGAGGPGSSGVGPGSGPGSGSGGAPAQTGIPCDVAMVLANNCVSCHSNPPIGGATMPLVTYADLVAPSPKGGSEADRSLVRMTDQVTPMPPKPNAPVSAADIATFSAWVNAGMPMGSCNQGSGGAGAGAGGNPYNTPEICTSMTNWNGGTDGSSRMTPGQACVSCHQKSGGEAPNFAVGGTVYATAHEPDNCNGINGTADPMSVVVTDAANNVITLAVNQAGNFRSSGSVKFPIKAKVVAGGNERAMAGAVTTGDCNSCHTLNGSGNPAAPGRIMSP